MTKPRKDQDKKRIELEPDAWARFERFVSAITKAGPQHRVSNKPHEESKLGKPKSERDLGKITPTKPTKAKQKKPGQ